MRSTPALLLTLLALAPAVALAHHGWSSYDSSKVSRDSTQETVRLATQWPLSTRVHAQSPPGASIACSSLRLAGPLFNANVVEAQPPGDAAIELVQPGSRVRYPG